MGFLIQQKNFTPDQLAAFKRYQRLSYDTLEKATEILAPGVTRYAPGLVEADEGLGEEAVGQAH